MNGRIDKKSTFYTLGFIFFMCVSCYLVMYIEKLMYIHVESLSIAVTLLMVLSIIFLVAMSDKGVWSVTNVFVIVFCLFHFGLIIVYASWVNLSIDLMLYLKKWWFSVYTGYSIVLVLMSLTVFVSAVSLTFALNKKKIIDHVENEAMNRVIPKVGFLMVGASVSIWFLDVLSKGGISLLTGSYSSYNGASATFLSGYHFYFAGFGLIFLAVSKPSRLRNVGIAMFIVFAIFALPMGLRGRVLGPIFVTMAVVGMKKVPLSTKKTIILGLCILGTSAVFRQTRQVGIAEMQFKELSFMPSAGLAEMGCSIRPVVEVVAGLDQGDDFIYGASYWAPFDRSLVYLIPGWTRPPVSEDDRFLAIRMSEQIGPIGYSMVAEAYKNFGVSGVFIFMFLIGILFAKMDLWSPTVLNQIKVGAIMLPLVREIRNAFISVPTTVVIGLIIVMAVKKYASKSKQNAAQPVKVSN